MRTRKTSVMGKMPLSGASSLYTLPWTARMRLVCGRNNTRTDSPAAAAATAPVAAMGSSTVGACSVFRFMAARSAEQCAAMVLWRASSVAAASPPCDKVIGVCVRAAREPRRNGV